jgi:hypothetical protein
MPKGGSKFADDTIYCDRCEENQAERCYEGKKGFLTLCGRCYTLLLRWLEGDTR